MIGGWVVYTVLVVTCVSAATALLASLRPKTQRGSRWVWFGGLVAVLALVGSAPFRLPPPTASIAPVAGDAVVGVPAPTRAADASMWVRVRHAAAAILDAPATVDGRLSEGTRHAVEAAWWITSLVVGALFALAFVGMYRRRSRWPHATVDGTAVRVTDGVGPLVVGLSRPEIALPPWAVALDVRSRALVLAHEIEHQRARDPLLLAVGALAVVLVPWHPGTWWMLRRLGGAIEVDCDARVLGRGVAARDYGLLLLDVASRSRPRSLWTPWPTLGVTSHLERRLLAMTTGPVRHSVARVLGGGGAAALLLLAACESKLPTSAEIEAMDGQAAVTAAQPLLADPARPTRYELDGKAVTEAEIKEVPSSAIASVDVQKGLRESVVRVRRAREDGSTAASKGALKEIAIDTARAVVLRDTAVIEERIDAPVGDRAPVRVRLLTPGGQPNERQLGPVEMRAEPLVVVDGEIKNFVDIKSLNPDRIDRVEVVKGSAARAGRFADDPRAANGIIFVYTKGGAAKP
ncbi:MAG: M56 family metallopeptidase [Gemmatimonadaceae bacterium]|jgi:beta-lactamase regulating signal transducer with metallopeptidase domain|nr:M56 family metallopeptidase [Gemmatimonadaceae bacterium]